MRDGVDAGVMQHHGLTAAQQRGDVTKIEQKVAIGMARQIDLLPNLTAASTDALDIDALVCRRERARRCQHPSTQITIAEHPVESAHDLMGETLDTGDRLLQETPVEEDHDFPARPCV